MSAPCLRLIDIRDLRFAWRPDLPAVLDLAELILERDRSLLVQGPSGSGKTTLLNLLGGVLVPQSGQLKVLDHDMAGLSGSQRDALRADQIGFLFQQFNLVPYLSVLDNVTLPCRFSLGRRRRATGRGETLAEVAIRLLGQLGMTGVMRQPVTELSVGQQQRVAAARALIGSPALVIADEPTSALDPELRDVFVEQLFDSCRAAGSSIVLVSHDQELGRHFDDVVDLCALNRAEISP